MPSSLARRLLIAAVAAAGAAAALVVAAGPAAAAPSYTVTLGATGTYPYPDDSPASGFIDTDGQFYFQSSASLYGATDPRYWDFYRGSTFADGTLDQTLSSYVNPTNKQDSNGDTTWRCNNSPTGKQSSFAPNSGYAQKNYCDLMGVWVDPDTGDWYGLVHNEFTPVPFPGVSGFQHYDAIDYAHSTDQGKTWTIEGHAITSPYSTTRNDNAAFPNQTWDYGDGDPRLFVDYKTGYFYVFYGSRIQNKSGASETESLAHVARAPISAKMAGGSWRKWYDGTWSQPGVGGLESNMVPVAAGNPRGYTAPAHDYKPTNPGTVAEQVAGGTVPTKSSLLVMNITYDAYLGLYIGEPEVVDQSTPSPQQFYATDDLTTQRWHLIGDSGNYKQASWYRWIVDGANLTSPTVVGKTFRSYCSIACATSDGEWVNVSIDSTRPAQPVRSGPTYRIATAAGQALAQLGTGADVASVPASLPGRSVQWTFTADGDGSYRIVNAGTGAALGVNSNQTAQRAWGTVPTASRLASKGPTLGQQWFVVPSGTSVRLVNRYSGLVLALGNAQSGQVATTPFRSWTNRSSSSSIGQNAGAQSLQLLP